jgi:hypothetical protein
LRRLATRNHSIGANFRASGAYAIKASRTGIANGGRIIVNRPVAIVVQSVAYFSRGIDVAIAYKRSIGTRLRSRRTHARLTCRTRRAHLLRIVVNQSIAVVVETIAKLDVWRGVLIANDCTIHAARATSSANTEVAGIAICPATRVAIIHRAIAIVIDTVAYFGRRRHVRIAHEHSIRARARSRRTSAWLGSGARRSNLRRVVVNHAIAIVIQTVTDFRR